MFEKELQRVNHVKTQIKKGFNLKMFYIKQRHGQNLESAENHVSFTYTYWYFLLFSQQLNPVIHHFVKLLMLPLVLLTMASKSSIQDRRLRENCAEPGDECAGKGNTHGHADEKGIDHF